VLFCEFEIEKRSREKFAEARILRRRAVSLALDAGCDRMRACVKSKPGGALRESRCASEFSFVNVLLTNV
jgi:hypothetical protein